MQGILPGKQEQQPKDRTIQKSKCTHLHQKRWFLKRVRHLLLFLCAHSRSDLRRVLFEWAVAWAGWAG
ncbi:hypothetical protein, partial [Faecalibacterium wellingii]|uniref:hypothetical protein n=1 Tax=Faecalibacterium wellingii TaxID=2929491 RepID=UPI003ED876C1